MTFKQAHGPRGGKCARVVVARRWLGRRVFFFFGCVRHGPY